MSKRLRHLENGGKEFVRSGQAVGTLAQVVEERETTFPTIRAPLNPICLARSPKPCLNFVAQSQLSPILLIAVLPVLKCGANAFRRVSRLYAQTMEEALIEIRSNLRARDITHLKAVAQNRKNTPLAFVEKHLPLSFRLAPGQRY